MSRFTFTADATPRPAPRSPLILPDTHFERNPSFAEKPKWGVLSVIRRWFNEDIDWWRVKYGKAEGEARFFAKFVEPDELILCRGNMLMGNGASALWQFALGNGTTTANSALGSGPTYFNNAQTNLYVGDGGITAGSGTVSVTNGSGSITFSGSQSSLQGKYLIVTGDSTNGIYTIVSGSGTAWTISPVFGGTTAGTASWSTLTAETMTQTALVGSTNTAHQAMDATFPSNSTTAQNNAITGATGANPCVLTISSGDISTNDIVAVSEVHGSAGTAPSGMYVANPASAGSVTLLGTNTTGFTYTYGGIVTKRNVFKAQATFGTSTANFAWWEWGLTNGTGGNLILLNRKVFNGGTKAGGTTSFQVGIGLV